MSKPTEWIDKFHEGLNDARQQTYALAEMSRAFRRVGNDVIADELIGIADVIAGDLKQMSDAVGEDLSRQVNQGWNQIGSVFSAALEVSGSEG